MLTHQDKYLYSFNIDKVVMDRSWDGLFYTEHGYQRRLSLIKPGTLLRSLLTRFLGTYRSNIIILAHKPKHYVVSPGIPAEDDFFPPEQSGTSESLVRAPLQARWMKAAATIDLQAPEQPSSIQQIDVLMWMPAPVSAGALRVEATINGTPCAPLEISPSVEPIRRILKPAKPIACTGGQQLTIHLRSTTWSPSTLGVSADDRSLGPMLHLEQIGIVAQQEHRPDCS